jgi:hypothetical protein
MPVEVYRHAGDVALSDAMLVWTRGVRVGVVPHPDYKDRSQHFRSSVGACFAGWRDMDERGRLLQFMIDLWHVSAFYDIPAAAAHQAALVIPEYRDTLARDCLPEEYQHERD